MASRNRALDPRGLESPGPIFQTFILSLLSFSQTVCLPLSIPTCCAGHSRSSVLWLQHYNLPFSRHCKSSPRQETGLEPQVTCEQHTLYNKVAPLHPGHDGGGSSIRGAPFLLDSYTPINKRRSTLLHGQLLLIEGVPWWGYTVNKILDWEAQTIQNNKVTLVRFRSKKKKKNLLVNTFIWFSQPPHEVSKQVTPFWQIFRGIKCLAQAHRSCLIPITVFFVVFLIMQKAGTKNSTDYVALLIFCVLPSPVKYVTRWR